MDILLYLIPIALTLGLLWLAGFLWALKNGQFEDPEGASSRILLDAKTPDPDDHKKNSVCGTET